MPLSDDIILWKINNSAITNGTYSNSKTTLMISDVQLSDAGIYTMVVTVGITNLAFVGSANTVLQVLGGCGQWCGLVWSLLVVIFLALPVITIDPVTMTTMEWQTVTLNCTGSNGVSITWYKENNDLPMTSSSNITINNGVTVTTMLLFIYIYITI